MDFRRRGADRDGEDRDGEDFWPFGSDPAPAEREQPPAEPARRQPGESVLPQPEQRRGGDGAGAGKRPLTSRAVGPLGTPRRDRRSPGHPPAPTAKPVRQGGDRLERRWQRPSAPDLGLLLLTAVVLALVYLALA